MENKIAFKVYGKFAMFTDPVTKIGGEKCSYHIPTYEALRGIARSIYWKPTFLWRIDKVKVIKQIKTQTKGVKPLIYSGSKVNSLSYYNYLSDVEYHVLAHFEWNAHASDLVCDRNENKHYSMLRRYLERGGTRDVFLGTRECQGYVEPVEWIERPFGFYRNVEDVTFGFMFHSFLYPEESGENELVSRFWTPHMRCGEIDFTNCEIILASRKIRPMEPKRFVNKRNYTEKAFDAEVTA